MSRSLALPTAGTSSLVLYFPMVPPKLVRTPSAATARQAPFPTIALSVVFPNFEGTPFTCDSILTTYPSHDDGTGGGSSLGNFKILLVYCDISGHGKLCITNETTRALSHGPTSASPGYFNISLAGSVSAEMTVTQHAALHHITYHDVFASGPPGLLVDLTNDGMHSFSNGSIQIVQLPSQGRRRRVVNETAAGTANATAQKSYRKKPQFNGVRVTGEIFKSSFGQGNYNVYFCLDAPGISAAATNTSDNITSATTLSPPSGSNAGALLQSAPFIFPPTSLYLRIGVSFLSTTRRILSRTARRLF